MKIERLVVAQIVGDLERDDAGLPDLMRRLGAAVGGHDDRGLRDRHAHRRRIGDAPRPLAAGGRELERGFDGENVGVAIIDTGIDFGHQDLAPAAGGFDGFGGNCQDDLGHGTHVAGIVAAIKGNQLDVVGVAPEATLYCVKVLDETGSGSDSVVIKGLEWISVNWDQVTPKIRVANMSLGRPGSIDDNSLLHSAIQDLYKKGIVVVVAAGNDPGSEVSQQIPAAYPEVLSVASTTAEAGANQCRRFNGFVDADTASYFTTDGAVTISAPGEQKENINKGCRLVAVGILSTQLGGGTTRKYGTSMAAPHVAGIVARLVQGNLATTDVEYFRGIVGSTADRIGTAPLNLPHRRLALLKSLVCP